MLRHISAALCEMLSMDRWPPRSPDLNPQDVYLWGHQNPLCMQLLLTMKMHFTIAMWMPVKTIRNCTGIFVRMRRSTMRRVEAFIESHGGHFQRTLSAVTHKLNVSGRILIWAYFLVLVYGTRAQSLSATFSYIPYIPTEMNEDT
jgi:hypothetical protein